MCLLSLQHYITLAAQANEQALAAYVRYINQHTPEAIRLANLARATLRRKFPNQQKRYQKLQDDRAVKPPANAFALFLKEQHAAQPHTGGAAQRITEITSHWKALNASEKQVRRLFHSALKATAGLVLIHVFFRNTLIWLLRIDPTSSRSIRTSMVTLPRRGNLHHLQHLNHVYRRFDGHS